MMLIAIDPGNVESAFVRIDDQYHLYTHEKISNESMLRRIHDYSYDCDQIVIERIASYGMAVGRSVFETCEWIGRFTQMAIGLYMPVDYVFRIDEKMSLCRDARAGDANIRRALIDRFARHDLRTGKGTKKNPDYFYGFAKDEWAAMAVAVAHLDRRSAKTSGVSNISG